MSGIDDIILRHSHATRDSLIPILQEIQDEIGYLSEESIVAVGKLLNLPTSKIYGLATFYNQFWFQPKGKYHIQICQGTTCHMEGAFSLIDFFEKKFNLKVGQTTRNGEYSLEIVPCLGACSKSPVISINGILYGSITAENLEEILEEAART
ncbi:MAG: NADH-quinone oxidoreductase subunit NuoE [Tenuifilaceae bacterium]|jgi:NADH-quinone oxidoreductase subunit E|nr:NADH-quinone oxidoreductase subunit NuoE [Bacteroidales bacterium]MDI9516372.1 NADH-quinone oxidoreductase subunit NuoE [Bacteroidota bacterium]NLH57471.1 NADH-quinone oxidoreductase subunit NuoE [Rikenellaceae bacterium]OQC62905.1 MAG: NADH-quinone oxidoreductase subunit E [Bacteroidetes bacterium ADurb.Bin008]HNV82230.1 NADH-quinone oxidoreductase subunit NuoE [Tenuifilaceae bacterium]